MNLEDYIKGERYGQEAYQLELEALNDPFLQDALDGYNLEDDHPTYHLKKLRQQIKKRTKNNFYYLQIWSVAAGALIIICLVILFFVLNRDNRTFFSKKPVYDTGYSNDPAVLNNMIDSLALLESTRNAAGPTPAFDDTDDTRDAVDAIYPREDTPPVIKTSPVQLPATSAANQKLALNQKRNKSRKHTLSKTEIQKIVSSYNENEARTAALSQPPPKPALGESAYSDYIQNNRRPLAPGAGEKHGKVILLFKVNDNGRPTNISILRPLCQAADQEAIRLLQDGPNWTTSNQSAYLEIDF